MPPEQLLYRLWAKTNDYARKKAKRRGERAPAWSRHPLPCHLLDVAHVADTWLAADPHLLDRFCALWPAVPCKDVRRALVLAAAVHDLAKVHFRFQRKSSEGWAYGYGTAGMFTSLTIPTGYDHGRGAAEFFSAFTDFELPAGAHPAWDTLHPLIHVAAGHHGTLFSENMEPDLDAIGDLTPLVAALLGEIEALFGPPPVLPPEPPPAFLMLAAGFVSVADWIGSDEHIFPHAEHVASRAAATAYLVALEDGGRARQTLERHGLIGRFTPPDTFEGLFDFSPYDGFQTDALDTTFGKQEGAEIALVEAPMGLGKTEIALALTARALRRDTADGLYAALPTQATANALFLRIRSFAERTKHPDADLALTLAHGARGFFQSYQEIVRKSFRPPFLRRPSYMDDHPDAPPSEVVAPTWMQSSKRALLAPLGLGTVDQALLGAMGVKHGFVRLFALARKVVVIDEVHSYDVYMGVLLRRLLEWLAVLDAKVILLSATLAPSARRSLLDAFGVLEATALPAPDYPLLLHGRPGEEATPHTGSVPVALKHLRKTVHVEPVVPHEDEDATAAGIRWLQEAVAKGGCVAWIRNTVREAQEAWRRLRDLGIEANLHHARFTRTDRNANEEVLLDTLGSPKRVAEAGKERPPHRVVVATQVVEQSVDVDFDAMLSDLAPVDLLLQRAGRLWRHHRPAIERHRHDTPCLAVLMPPATERTTLRFGPSAYVYDAETLARSALLALENPHWSLPEACRTLVADLYDGSWDHARLGCDAEALEKTRAKHRVEQDRMERNAKKTLVSPTTAAVPFVRQARTDLGDADCFVHLGTRYESFRTAAIVLCRLAESGFAGLGLPGRRLVVPPEDDYPARLAVEEAVALSTVSFPWNRDLPQAGLPAPLEAFARWWRESHPYDDRRFVVLDPDGACNLEGAYVRYTRQEGLVIQRERPDDLPSDHPLPEHLDF